MRGREARPSTTRPVSGSGCACLVTSSSPSVALIMGWDFIIKLTRARSEVQEAGAAWPQSSRVSLDQQERRQVCRSCLQRRAAPLG